MLIAHKTETEQKPLNDHLLKTSLYCANNGSSFLMYNTCKLLGLTHDLGKASDAFQDYIKDNKGDYKKGEIDHAVAGGQYLYDLILTQNSKYKKVIAQILSVVIFSHHGGLNDFIDIEGKSPFINRLSKQEDKSYKTEVLTNIDTDILNQIQLLIPKVIEELELFIDKLKINFNKKQDFLFNLGIFTRLLLSCLVDADRTHAYESMTGNIIKETYITWNDAIKKLEQKIFLSTNQSLNDIRNEIAETCQKASLLPTDIYELTLPCGAGKTLSSLKFALNHAKIYNKKRIIYVVPFTTIIEQNAKVIRDILGDIILEHHSNLSDESEKYFNELISENWHSQIIFTTNVQFMNALFDSGTKSLRRLQAIANSIIIFDEVQAMPVKCVSMFNTALNFLKLALNTTVILCSATQPVFSKVLNHPLHVSEDKCIVPNFESFFDKLRRTTAIDLRISGGYEINMLGDFILKKYNECKSVLCIVNTKYMAKSLYKYLNINENFKGKLFHLSTSMCPLHRMDILNVIKKSTQKICISTALIEAGVDISFACVIRSVASLDSIVQSAGRCNREGESKNLAPVYIVNPKDENVSKLKDILEGQRVTNKILDEMKRQKDLYNGDLFSNSAIEKYFEYYFFERANEMDYNLKQYNTTLFELLSTNTLFLNEHNRQNKDKFGFFQNQSFRFANENFKMIDQKTIDVLVPYKQNEQNNILDALQKSYKKTDVYETIRKARKITVSLFETDFKKIDKVGGIYLLNKNLNIFAVTEDCYNDFLGVIDERELENLVL